MRIANTGQAAQITNRKRQQAGVRGKISAHGRLPADAPGVVIVSLTSGRCLRILFSILRLISRLGRRIGSLRLRSHLLLATVFPLKLLPQFALNAGMRRHYFTIRLCQSV